MLDKTRLKSIVKKVVICLVVFAVIISLVHQTMKVIFLPGSYEVKDFNTYRKDLKKIVDSLWDEYIPLLKEDDSISYIRLFPIGDAWKGWYVFKDTDKENESIYRQMDKNLIPCISSVYYALPPDSEGCGSFHGIYISKTQIAFVRSGEHYALVYSRYTRPVCISNDMWKCFVDQIYFNWYQVRNVYETAGGKGA